MRLILIALVSSLFVACNPCKRAQKALSKCPQAASDTVTVVIDDTVIVQGVRVDTLFECGDTLIVDSGRVRVELMPYYIHKTDTTILRYAVRAECKPDTVIQQGQIVRQTVTNRHIEPRPSRAWYIIAFFSGIIVTLLGLWLAGRK